MNSDSSAQSTLDPTLPLIGERQKRAETGPGHTDSANTMGTLAKIFGRLRVRMLSPVAWFSVLYGCSIVVLYLCLGAAESPTLWGWFNGDTLFPVHVIKDTLVDGAPLSGWRFCPAPFIFPDAVIVGIFYLVTGNAILANFLTGAAFISLAALGFAYCGHLARCGDAEVRNCATLLGAALFTLYIATHLGADERVLFLPAYHSGTYVTSIWAFACFLFISREDTNPSARRIALAVLGGLCFLGTSGDPLTLPMFVAPATAAGVLCYLCGLIKWSRISAPLVVAWTSGITGAIFVKQLLNIASTGTFAKPSLERSGLALSQLSIFFFDALAKVDIFHWLGVIWIAVGLSAVFVARQRSRSKVDEESRNGFPSTLAMMLACFAFSSLGMLAAPVVGGHTHLIESPNYPYISHYFHPFLYGPVFGGPMVLMALFPISHISLVKRRVIAGVLCTAGGVFMVIITSQVSNSDHLPHRYQTRFVAEVEAIVAKYGLNDGICCYWKAREINLLSHSGSRAISILSSMDYFDWMNNKAWIDATYHEGTLNCDYIIVDTHDGFTREKVIEQFGEPAYEEEISAEGLPSYSMLVEEERYALVMIYNRPSDEKFRNYFDPPFSKNGSCKVMSASELPSHTGQLEDGERVARSGRDEAGPLSYGPYVELPAGEYVFIFETSVHGENVTTVGTWDIGAVNPKTERFEALGEGVITPGDENIRAHIVVGPQEAGRVFEARIHYSGNGRLALKGLEIERIR